MFGRRPAENALAPRQPHPNAVIDSHLRTLDLIRERIRAKQDHVATLYREIEKLLAKARANTGFTKYLKAAEAARGYLPTLEGEITALTDDVDHRQKEAEAAEERWMQRVAHNG